MNFKWWIDSLQRTRIILTTIITTTATMRMGVKFYGLEAVRVNRDPKTCRRQPGMDEGGGGGGEGGRMGVSDSTSEQ